MRPRSLVPGLATAMIATLLFATESREQRKHINGMVDLLQQGQVVFGSIVLSRTAEAASKAGRDPYIDFMTHPMETGGLDVPRMQAMLSSFREVSPNKMGIEGNRPVLVKIPPIGDDLAAAQNWIKDLLNTGISGIVVPHVQNAEQALQAIRMIRFPQPDGAPDAEPVGSRPLVVGNAARYWGVSEEEYIRKADIWPI